MGKIMELVKRLDPVSKRVGVLGCTLIQEVLQHVQDIVDSYFALSFERLSNGDSRFIADEFNSMLGEYQEVEMRLLAAVNQEISNM